MRCDSFQLELAGLSWVSLVLRQPVLYLCRVRRRITIAGGCPNAKALRRTVMVITPLRWLETCLPLPAWSPCGSKACWPLVHCTSAGVEKMGRSPSNTKYMNL